MTQQCLVVCGLAAVSLFVINACLEAPAGHLWPIVRAISGVMFLGLIYRKSKRKSFDRRGKSEKRRTL